MDLRTLIITINRYLLICFFLFLPSYGYAQERDTRISHVTKTDSQIPYGEPYIAVNPLNPSEMIVASLYTKEVERFNPSLYNANLFVTTNNGKDWKKIQHPPVKDEVGKGDPWIVWGNDGVIYFSCMVFVKESDGKTRLKVYVYTSKDSGETWSDPIEVFKGTNGLDHAMITYNHNSKVPIGMYVTGGYGLASTQVVFANSGFSEMDRFKHLEGNSSNNNLGSGVVLDNGDFVFIQTKNLSELRSVSTSDLGETFVETTITKDCIPYGFPMLDADNSGGKYNNRIYAVWSEQGDVGTQIFISHSDTAGKTWSKNQQVSSNSESINLMPQIKVNNNGDLLIVWVSSKSNQKLDCINLNYALSANGGKSFVQKPLFNDKFCSSTKENGSVVERWKLGGDYFGIDADSSGDFHVAWADSRIGIFQIWHSKVSKSLD